MSYEQHLLRVLGRRGINHTADGSSLKAMSIQTMFDHFIETENVTWLKLIIKLGVNLDLEDRNGRTPLVKCIDIDNPDLIEALIEGNVDVNKPTPDGDTPLIYAMLEGKMKSAEALLQCPKERIYLELIGKDHLTALQLAIKTKNYQLTKLITDLKPSDLPNTHGRRALFFLFAREDDDADDDEESYW